MNGCPPNDPTLNQFIAEIDRLPPRPHHTGLLELAARLMPACRFRFVYKRGGWYQPGGVIRPDGTPVAADAEAWLTDEMAVCGDDIDTFLDRHGDDGLLVTRHAGQTHFFVAAYGPEPADFMQLEVEELQEVLDRLLIDPEAPPADADELAEPPSPHLIPAQPVGRPRHRFRRLVDLSRIAARVGGGVPGAQAALTRFMTEWQDSGAARSGHFSEHWLVTVREYPDRYGNPMVSATPISLQARKLRHFHWQPDTRGTDLGDQIRAFDRAAGYPSAWYFHLVAGGLVPRELAYALMDDWVEGFRYLADCDAELLRGWVEQPYSV